MERIFLACFFVGLIATVALAVVGRHGHGHGPAHAHGASAAHLVLGLLNLSSLLAALMLGGGAGYLALRLGAPRGGVVAAASAAALVGAGAMAIIVRAIARAEAGLLVEQDPTGTQARVIAAIRERGIGEIAFPRDGARGAMPARSDDGAAIERDAEVVIMRVERGVAFVRRSSELFNREEEK